MMVNILLQELYTVMFSFGICPMEHVFAHPYYVNGSPFKIDNPLPFRLENISHDEAYELVWKRRESYAEAYEKFFASMETRTPELLLRIERTNELAAKILERAKEPESTISRNMVEFIQLRGFLVDMRYAENPKAEKAAFDKLLDFVENAQDKKLWVKFLYEIGFDSIVNHTHFPAAKVQEYRELFGKRFPDAFDAKRYDLN